MSIQYKLDIKHIPKDAAILDIYYNGQEKVSPLSKLVPINHYEYISIRKESMYLDMDKMVSKIGAADLLWETFNIFKIYIYIPDSLLYTDNDVLEFTLASCIRSLLSNIYKAKNEIIITHDGKENAAVKNIISMIEKVQAARMMSMLPANLATPELIAKRLQGMFKKIQGVKTAVLGKTYLEKHKFGLILAVNAGSNNKPCILTVERQVNPKNPTVCIIGKGITFDSGGLAIKPIRSMKDMKFDKIGAVCGAMALMHLIELPALKHVNLVGVFPFAENVISSGAVKPGDVIRSFSGKTVEITNPDAEGRLVLADAFAYSARYKPDIVIDIATLTGHAEYINCWHNGYYFAQPESMKHLFEKRTNDIGERMIPMPTWSEYREVLQSTVADLLNDSDICDDSFTAALFLKEFLPAECAKWLHIDLSHEKKNRIPLGNGIRSIIDIVTNMYKKK